MRAFQSPDFTRKRTSLGHLPFTEQNANKIGRMTPSGAMTEFFIQHSSAQPEGITTGRNGGLWFTELNTQQMKRRRYSI